MTKGVCLCVCHEMQINSDDECLLPSTGARSYTNVNIRLR